MKIQNKPRVSQSKPRESANKLNNAARNIFDKVQDMININTLSVKSKLSAANSCRSMFSPSRKSSYKRKMLPKNQIRIILNNTKDHHITEPTPIGKILRQAVKTSKYLQYNRKREAQ